MISSQSDRIARRTAHLRAGASALAAGVLLAGLTLANPAGAQWIGAAGGQSDTGSSSSSAAPSSSATIPGDVSTSIAPGGTGAQGLAPMESEMGTGMGGMGAPGGLGMSAPGMAAPGMGAPGMGAPGAGDGPSPAEAANIAECQSQVDTLRGEVETRGKELQKATKRKASPVELCPMFRNFVSTQQKFISYLTKNQSKCHVPDEALKELKTNASGVSGVRDKVCQVAKLESEGGGAPGLPPQGSLSAGLGLSSGLPSGSQEKGGVFDTLVGDALH
uniref:hypothetical protein n=1 Tax=Ancylobacter mangrovi TaxID=2972472 RepID=UPI002867E594|nr:hypothetical protein [Ancylobacter mangrovi]